jgi:endoplasmic reticulum protein 29
MKNLLALHFMFNLFKFSSAANCAGCVPLDTLTFDKVLSKFSVSVVKFDVAYPYGDKHDEFAKVAKEAASVPDLFVGEVGIKDYGEQENGELGQRFKVTKEEYPTVILFVKNNQEGSLNHYKFAQDFTAENLKNFIKENSGVRLPLQGCIEQFDVLADEFLASSKTEKETVIRSAEASAKGFESPDKEKAETYVKIMRKLMTDADFLAKEETRLNKVLAGKLTKEKKASMEERLNILKSFNNPSGKDEL